MQQHPPISFYGLNVRPRRHYRRSDRIMPAPIVIANPLTECRVEGCQRITTVGQLCLTHWEEKVSREQPGRVTPAPRPRPDQAKATNLPAPTPRPIFTTPSYRPHWIEIVEW